MEEICLSHVAIRFVKYTYEVPNYAVFEFGRVSDTELKVLEKAYTRPLAPRNGDPTNGTLQKSEGKAGLYTVRLCLFVDDIREGKYLIEETHDNSDVTISWTDFNIRPTLRSIKHGSGTPWCPWFERFSVDWDQCITEETAAKKYFFADILCQKIGYKEGVYTINARSDKTKVIFVSTATEFNQRDDGLGNLISEAMADRRIHVYDRGAKRGDYVHGTFVPYVQDCIEATAEKELPCRAIFEASNPPKIVGMIFISPSYVEQNADNLPTVQLLDETMIKMCLSDGHLKKEDQAQLYKEKEETTMPEGTPKEVQLRQVAIRVDSSTGRGTTKITIGRLSPDEYNGIKKMIGAYGTGEYRNTWTGRSRGSYASILHEISFWVHNSVTLKNIDIANARIVANCQSMAVEITDVQDLGGDALGSLRESNWFGFETKTFFEARGVVICNHGSSGLQIGRLDNVERKNFDTFAGEYSSALNGRFNRLLTDESVFIDNDRVLKNVSFAAGLGFIPGESICIDHIRIERTGNKFKVVAAERCDEENVEERWHLTSAETPENRRLTLDNVAVKVTKKVGSLEYYILEIGRLAADELDRLKKVYRHVGDFNTRTHEMDETKGKVLSREVRVVDGDGETWTYYVAKVCVYWPEYTGRSKNMIGKVIDSAQITLESHHGNFRPTLENIEENEEIHNQYSGRWFEKFPFEEKDDGFVYVSRSRISGKTAELKRMLNAAYGVRISEGADFDGDAMRYCLRDAAIQAAIQTESMWRRKSFEEETMKARMPEITNIEFRDPATIVFWSDGTKTVVRCQNGEKYDPEKGMAMAICRKVYGNERDYYHLFLHWMKKARKVEAQTKDEKPTAKKKTPAKKPATAQKKKGGKK